MIAEVTATNVGIFSESVGLHTPGSCHSAKESHMVVRSMFVRVRACMRACVCVVCVSD